MSGQNLGMNSVVAQLEARQLLSSELRGLLLSLEGEAVFHPRHRDIVRIGETSRAVHFLQSGLVCRSEVLHDRRRSTTAIYVPGDLVDPASLAFQKNVCAMTALTESTTIRVEASIFFAAVEQSSALLAWLWRSVCAEAAAISRWSSLKHCSARVRLANILCDLSNRLGNATVIEGMNHEQYGEVMGVTVTHVGRIVHELSLEKILRVDRNRLKIINLLALQEIAKLGGTNAKLTSLSGSHFELGFT